MPEKLTKKQQVILDYIERFISVNHYGPTVREICEEMGLSSPSTAHTHLKSLESKGYITRDPMKSRSIALTSYLDEDKQGSNQELEPVPCSKIINLPVVGDVAAGSPLLAQENITDYISLPIDIVGDDPSFLLSVRGESMIDIGINNGDYVVVKEQPVANNGDIVVALVEEGATVKRFFKEKDQIRLQPENSSMEPIIVQDCSIAGKVVAVFRRL